MKDSPPAALVDLLAGLGLARGGELRGVAGRARRLAGGLPQFDSVWIDALVQARLLTPWQAVELNAGRGAALKAGPFVIFDRLATLGYATLFRAREIEGERFVRLAIASADTDLNDAERRLALLMRRTVELPADRLVPLVQHGRDDARLWAASEFFAGRTARQWMMGHGRMPPPSTLEVARQMADGLLACERAGIVHADIGADQLWFDAAGLVRLPEPGLRGVLRPTESGRARDLPAESYDYLAPERLLPDALCDVRGDIYACGALWWHLLTGRPPFAGATAETKLRTVQSGKLPDIRQLAPETPAALAEMVMRCLARDPAERPDSFAVVASALGEPVAKEQKRLARRLRSIPRRSRWFGRAAGAWPRSPRTSTWLAAATGVLLAVTIIAWPAISPRLEQLAADETEPQRVAAARPAVQKSATPRPTTRRSTARQRPAAPSPSDRPNALPTPDHRRSDTAPVAAEETSDGMFGGEGPAAQQDEEAQDFNANRVATPSVPADWQESASVVAVSADTPIDLSLLKSGQTLRGDAERRPAIEVPPEGLELLQSDVTLENIDFFARLPLRSETALLTLRGLKTSLRGCSFQTVGDWSADTLPVAIRYDRRSEAGQEDGDFSTGELDIRDTTFRHVAMAAACRLVGGMVVRFDNVLCVEAGPGIQFDRFPEAEELAALVLSRVTLRGARSLVQVGCDELPTAPGHLEIEAVDCAFVLPAAAALIVFHGEERPGPLLRGLRWSGQGSVLSPRSRLSIWRTPEGRMLAAADEAVPIQGVVRGEVGFAGPLEEVPAGARIVRWQAPLSSPRPPGIDDGKLHLPDVEERSYLK
ncbi:MAG TPA: protein kinase [Pirellulales bacterium]|nr:protein kinase [Pirellulales bacterium]